jgi:hypothetical protein
LAEGVADEMETAIPGFRAALQYPYFIPRDDDHAVSACRFCGQPIDVSRELCDACEKRHQPATTPELEDE